MKVGKQSIYTVNRLTGIMRALETAAQSGQIQPFSGDSELFIYPGKPIHCVDALFTNFHLPRSSLLMLVAAFAGYEKNDAGVSACGSTEIPFF